MNDRHSVFGNQETAAVICGIETDSLTLGDENAFADNGAPDLRATPDSCTRHQDGSCDISARGDLHCRRYNGLNNRGA
jgi:hypothetical protein